MGIHNDWYYQFLKGHRINLNLDKISYSIQYKLKIYQLPLTIVMSTCTEILIKETRESVYCVGRLAVGFQADQQTVNIYNLYILKYRKKVNSYRAGIYSCNEP